MLTEKLTNLRNDEMTNLNSSIRNPSMSKCGDSKSVNSKFVNS